MNMRIIFICIVCLSMCFFLVGCGDNNESRISNENNEVVEQESVKNNVEKTNPDMNIADNWMKLPQNVNMFWRTDEKGTNNYYITQEYKRGNNVMKYGESVENGVHITAENNAVANEYYYYNHLGDYNWNAYVYFHNQGWDNWYFKGNYPSSPQCYCFGRPWNILDNYTNNHETINIDGLGEVDTVTGTDDEGYTYYYSKDLGFNVKIENNVQSWYLTSFNTNVTDSFPHALPDMEALANKESTDTSNVSNFDGNSQNVIEDDNGELIIFDE